MTEPHPEGEHWVAQEGAFSAGDLIDVDTSLRGSTMQIRLILGAKPPVSCQVTDHARPVSTRLL